MKIPGFFPLTEMNKDNKLMGGSISGSNPGVIIHCNGIFPHKPSICVPCWGTPTTKEPPQIEHIRKPLHFYTTDPSPGVDPSERHCRHSADRPAPAIEAAAPLTRPTKPPMDQRLLYPFCVYIYIDIYIHMCMEEYP